MGDMFGQFLPRGIAYCLRSLWRRAVPYKIADWVLSCEKLICQFSSPPAGGEMTFAGAQRQN